MDKDHQEIKEVYSMKFKNILILLVFIILFFIIGLFYDTEYRILTRTLVSQIANYDLRFYGGKEFRFFIPDFGFILTLIPIGFYIITKFKNSVKTTFISVLFFISLLILYYFFFCYLESQIIKYTTVADNKNIYYYHHSNVNYRLIAFSSIVASLISEYFLLYIRKNTIQT